MGSEGEGGTPKPTACRTFPAFGRFTVQNLLSSPVVPRRRSGALTRPKKLGLRQAVRKGTQMTNPRNSSGETITGTTCRRIRRCARRTGRRPDRAGKRSLQAVFYAYGRIREDATGPRRAVP